MRLNVNPATIMPDLSNGYVVALVTASRSGRVDGSSVGELRQRQVAAVMRRLVLVVSTGEAATLSASVASSTKAPGNAITAALGYGAHETGRAAVRLCGIDLAYFRGEEASTPADRATE